MGADIRRIEEMSLNAWPALRQVVYDGWLLRFSDGYTGRANSVQPLYDGTLDVREKIRFCEETYRRAQLPVLFKLTDAALPTGLDARLETSGYRSFNHTIVQVSELDAHAPGEIDPDVTSHHRASAPWLEAVVRFRSIPALHALTFQAIVDAIVPETRFATISEDGEVVACGLAVLEGGWVGLFDIVTREDRQRRGLATRLVSSLLAWAKEKGATRAYLQVMSDNTPALRLYERLGFREAYEYWYRSKQP